MTDNEKPLTPKRAVRKEPKKTEAPEPHARQTAPAAAASTAAPQAAATPTTGAAPSTPGSVAAQALRSSATATVGSIQTAAFVPPECRKDPPIGVASAAQRPTLSKSAPHPAVIRRGGLAGFARKAAYGLGLAAAVGAGYAGNLVLVGADPAGVNAMAFSMGQSQAEMRRLADDVRALKESVVALGKNTAVRAAVPQGGAVDAEELRVVNERLTALSEGVERMKQDSGAKLSQVSTQLDRVEKIDRDPAKVAALVERLDRIDRQTAALVTGNLPSEGVGALAGNAGQTTLKAQARSDEQKPLQKPIDGWVLRDLFDGVALIEGRRGIVEIAPGQTIAGIGRVEKFERRGRQWVVVTDKGIISSAQ